MPDSCDTKQEVSAVCYRHTYTIDPKAVNPKLLPMPAPGRDFTKPLRDKNVRNMRLRPRKVLCAKCKQGVHDNVTVHTTCLEDGKGDKNVIKDNNSMDLKRRKMDLEIIENTPRKSKRLEENAHSKTSPAIKISFANPQGRGTVVQIPPKPNIENPCNLSGNPSDSDGLRDSPLPYPAAQENNRDQYKKLKKAMKKAKEKESKAEHSQSDAESHSSSKCGTTHRKSKRAKHKRKHRHKLSPNPHHKEDSLDGENLKENSDLGNKINDISKSDVFPISNPISNISCFESMNIRSEDDNGGVLVLSPRCENPVAPSPASKQYDSDGSHTLVIIEDDTQDLFPPGSVNTSDGDLGASDNDIGGNSPPYDMEDQENCEELPSELPNSDDRTQSLRPLMMRIQTKNVSKVLLDDGRTFRNGDVVWGKIHGFPWWPGRIISITESLKDSGVIITQTAHISWFASSTMSHMACQELYPFLDDFKLRYNKRKKGSYKQAVKQATLAAQSAANADLKDVDIDLLDD